MENAHAVFLNCEHFIETLVAMRRFIHAGATQLDISSGHFGVQHLTRDLASTLDLAGLAINDTRCITTTHHAACAVDGAIESQFRLLTFDTLKDDGRFCHGPTDKSLLTGKCRSRPFAHTQY